MTLRDEILAILKTESRHEKLGGLGGYLPSHVFWANEIVERINETRWFFNKVDMRKVHREITRMESEGIVKKIQWLFWEPGNFSVELEGVQHATLL